MSKMRGYIDPNEYVDHAMIALEKALETDAPIKCFRRPVRELLTESRRLRTLNQELDKRAEKAEAKAQRLHEKLTAALAADIRERPELFQLPRRHP